MNRAPQDLIPVPREAGELVIPLDAAIPCVACYMLRVWLGLILGALAGWVDWVDDQILMFIRLGLGSFNRGVP